MWQRFTEDARLSIYYAQEAAGCRGQLIVRSEHILAGVLVTRKETKQDQWPPAPRFCDQATTRAGKVLLELGISVEEVLTLIDNVLPPRLSDPKTSDNMRLDFTGKRVIDGAYYEARAMRSSFIYSEHLLLGIIQKEDFAASK